MSYGQNPFGDQPGQNPYQPSSYGNYGQPNKQ